MINTSAFVFLHGVVHEVPTASHGLQLLSFCRSSMREIECFLVAMFDSASRRRHVGTTSDPAGLASGRTEAPQFGSPKPRSRVGGDAAITPHGMGDRTGL